MPRFQESGQTFSEESDFNRHLTIIAGPSCAGKSTLIEALQNGQFPQLRQQLGLSSSRFFKMPWPQKMLKLTREEHSEHSSVLHLDLYAKLIRQDASERLRDILSMFDSISVLTLYVSSETLAARVVDRVKMDLSLSSGCSKQKTESVNQLRLLWKLLDYSRFAWRALGRIKHCFRSLNKYLIYRNPQNVTAIYREWSELLSDFPHATQWCMANPQDQFAVAIPHSNEMTINERLQQKECEAHRTGGQQTLDLNLEPIAA